MKGLGPVRSVGKSVRSKLGRLGPALSQALSRLFPRRVLTRLQNSGLSKNSDGASRRAEILSKLIAAANWIQVRSQPLVRRVNWEATRAGALIFALAFVFASAVSTFAVGVIIRAGAPTKRASMGSDLQIGNGLGTQAKTVDDSGASATEMTRKILGRNVFNSDGALAPDDTVVLDAARQISSSDFGSVPCSGETLPVEVLGTIDTGNPFASFVTVKDQKVAYADTYKVGSLIIDYEDYEVYKVTREVVEFRKGDQKICVTINKPSGSSSAAKAASGNGGRVEVSPENIVNLEFTAEELSQGIGPGYAKILESAKLIPLPNEAGGISGFKLIAIRPDSLFNKLKMQDQDIVTEVNGVSLKDASEGFKLYQALQEEREINVRVMRGEVPMTFIIRVK